MKRGFLLCAERVGLIRCFASHSLRGQQRCRVLSQCLSALFEPTPWVLIPPKSKKQPSLMGRLLFVAERVGLTRSYRFSPLSGQQRCGVLSQWLLPLFEPTPWVLIPPHKMKKATLIVMRIAFFSGEGGIRTHGTIARTTVFETARFNHSRTSPYRCAGLAAQRDCEYKHLGPFVQGFSGERGPACNLKPV